MMGKSIIKVTIDKLLFIINILLFVLTFHFILFIFRIKKIYQKITVEIFDPALLTCMSNIDWHYIDKNNKIGWFGLNELKGDSCA